MFDESHRAAPAIGLKRGYDAVIPGPSLWTQGPHRPSLPILRQGILQVPRFPNSKG